MHAAVSKQAYLDNLWPPFVRFLAIDVRRSLCSAVMTDETGIVARQGEMRDFEADLRRELAELRHGWGVQRSDLSKRIGPAIARWADISPHANDAQRRIKDAILRLFPDDGNVESLGFAIRVGLGIQQMYSYPTLGERTERLAGELSVSSRTVRRRMDEGFAVLAELAAEEMEPFDPNRGWTVDRFHALVRLDRAQPEAIEERTIVATADGLRRLVIRFSLPRTGLLDDEAREVDVEVQHGALLVASSREGKGHFCFELDLPVTLKRGDEHSFTMIVRVVDGKPIRDYYTYTPLNSCTSCEIRVRFGADRLPEALWRLEEVPPRVLADPDVTGSSLLRLDVVGEISQRFTGLRQGFGYGVGWRFG
jgi:hypothetical protein